MAKNDQYDWQSRMDPRSLPSGQGPMMKHTMEVAGKSDPPAAMALELKVDGRARFGDERTRDIVKPVLQYCIIQGAS
jgi:hypothetical protein